MFNELSQRYLKELRAAEQQLESSNLMEETHDGSGHEVLETHTSEYNIELGPLKVNVKKSRTVSGKASQLKKSTQSVAKENLTNYENAVNQSQINRMRQLQSPDTDLPENYKRIDISI